MTTRQRHLLAIGLAVGTLALAPVLGAFQVPVPLNVVVGFCAGLAIFRLTRQPPNDAALGAVAPGSFSDGDAVEVDCRRCGQFNRVAAPRLRDRPICGRCKERLMPGRRLVICRISKIEGRLRTELNTLWDDEDLLWGHIADRVRRPQEAAQPSEVN